MGMSHYNSISGYLNHEINATSIIFFTDKQKLRIQLLTTGAFRITAIKKEDSFFDFSYAVIHQKFDVINVNESKESFRIKHQNTVLIIDKNPMRLSFFNENGILINADEKAFGIAWDGEEVTNYKQLNDGEIFLGLGEKAGNLNRRGSYYTNWNTDAFGYGVDSDPIYASIPFFIGINNQLPYGIFFNNSSKTNFNFGCSNNRFSFFQAEKGQLDYYFFHKTSIPEIIEDYTELTGRTELPPMWSLGYQQCRYSYYPDKEVLSVAQNFRDRNIPADVIYLDIHYMQNYKVFTWNNERFPNPELMLKKLKSLGFKVVLIVDPGVKVEAGYEVYDDGIKHDVFAKYPDGTNFSGEVWPGWCHFPDFTKPKTRDWFGKFYEKHLDEGVSGFWNDMNEPALWGQKFPNLVEFDYEGYATNFKLARNVYGLNMCRSTYEGNKKARPKNRPFVLTRSGFSGIQRYAAVWTGDNTASEEHLLLAARLVNSLGISGVANAGTDVGGFVGECSIELYARWIALGAFTPFFRGHTMINSRDTEPWAFGEEAEEISRNYINLRYRLLPYLYSAFYEASKTGLPINKTLAMYHFQQEEVFDTRFQNQFYFGKSILVCPALPNKEAIKVYLPEGKWYDLFNDNIFDGNSTFYHETPIDKIPIFVKESGIIVMQKLIQNTEEKAEKLEIHIYNGTSNNSFELYEDDGKSYEYENKHFNKRNISWNPILKTIEISEAEGSFESSYKSCKVYLHGFENLSHIENKNVQFKLNYRDYNFVDPISNFDPFEKREDKSKTVEKLPYFDINWEKNKMKFSII